MTIHELMNRSPVNPDIKIRVFDLFHNRLIYDGRYDESSDYVQRLDVHEYDITCVEERTYNPGKYYIASMTITADVF